MILRVLVLGVTAGTGPEGPESQEMDLSFQPPTTILWSTSKLGAYFPEDGSGAQESDPAYLSKLHQNPDLEFPWNAHEIPARRLVGEPQCVLFPAHT